MFKTETMEREELLNMEWKVYHSGLLKNPGVYTA
jgi:hypothetical protein